MAFDLPSQESSTSVTSSGATATTACVTRESYLDLRSLEALSLEQCRALLQHIMERDLQPEGLYLPLDADIIEKHTDDVKEVLSKLKGSLKVVTVSHYSLSRRPLRNSPAQLDVLDAVLRLPLQRLRLFSPRDSGRRGAPYLGSLDVPAQAALTCLDLRCSGTYFNEACARLVNIQKATLRQVRLPERSSEDLLRAVASCGELESLGLPDLRLLNRLNNLRKVQEVLVTSMSSARRPSRGLSFTRRVILHSAILQQVHHISLEERFWKDLFSISKIGHNVRKLSLRGFSSLKLRAVYKAFGQFSALETLRLFHCEVQEAFQAKLESLGLNVEIICKRPSSPGVLMTRCSAIDCDTCVQNVEDIPIEVRKLKEGEILKTLKEEVDTIEKRQALERQTAGQSKTPLWIEKRQFRLTSSHFADVCKRRDSTLCHNLVKRILFPPSLDHISAVRWGRMKEKEAKEKYTSRSGNEVEECGLFVHGDLPFLGASPDGRVGENGLLEIKCFKFGKSLQEALKDTKLRRRLPVEIVELETGPTLSIKVNHPYNFQIQGQLAICQKEWCDLVMHGRQDEEQLVVRVFRDEGFWTDKMLPRLVRFYTLCLLPELADSRIRRGLQAREPQFILKALDEEINKRGKKRVHIYYMPPLYPPSFLTQFENFGIAGLPL